MKDQRSTKVVKTMDLASNFHGEDFYSKNLKSKKFNLNLVTSKDRDSRVVEIDNLKNFENFDFSEIKTIYAKKGIHIYDYKEESKHSNGNNEGKVIFKVRDNTDEAEFYKKLKDANEELSQKGFIPKEKEESAIKAKKIGGCVPVSLKWNDNRVRSMTSKLPTYETKVMVPTKIKAEE